MGWEVTGNVRGPQGYQGAQGSQGAAGSGGGGEAEITNYVWPDDTAAVPAAGEHAIVADGDGSYLVFGNGSDDLGTLSEGSAFPDARMVLGLGGLPSWLGSFGEPVPIDTQPEATNGWMLLAPAVPEDPENPTEQEIYFSDNTPAQFFYFTWESTPGYQYWTQIAWPVAGDTLGAWVRYGYFPPEVIEEPPPEFTWGPWNSPFAPANERIGDLEGFPDYDDEPPDTVAQAMQNLQGSMEMQLYGYVANYVTRPFTFTIPGDVAVQTGTLKIPVAANGFCRVMAVAAKLDQAPTGAPLIFDVKWNGTSVFEDPPEFADGDTDPDIGPILENLMSPGDYITLDILGVGSSTPGSDLVVVVDVSIPQQL